MKVTISKNFRDKDTKKTYSINTPADFPDARAKFLIEKGYARMPVETVSNKVDAKKLQAENKKLQAEVEKLQKELENKEDNGE